MNKSAILLATLALAIGVAVCVKLGQQPEQAHEPAEADLPPLIYPRQVVPIEAPGSQTEQALLKQTAALVARLETLETELGRLRSDIALRESSVARRPATEPAIEYGGERVLHLQPTDLDDIARRVGQELVNEAWRARQEQCVVTGRWLMNEVGLRIDSLNALIELIVRYEKQWFQIERQLAAVDHGVNTARLVGEDQRRARVALHRDLKRLYVESELVARLFLHVASHGEVASLSLGKEDLFLLETNWLK